MTVPVIGVLDAGVGVQREPVTDLAVADGVTAVGVACGALVDAAIADDAEDLWVVAWAVADVGDNVAEGALAPEVAAVEVRDLADACGGVTAAARSLRVAGRAFVPGRYVVAVDDGVEPRVVEGGPFLRSEIPGVVAGFVPEGTGFRWVSGHVCEVDVGESVWRFDVCEVG